MLERIDLLEAATIFNQRQSNTPPAESYPAMPATFSPSQSPQPAPSLAHTPSHQPALSSPDLVNVVWWLVHDEMVHSHSSSTSSLSPQVPMHDRSWHWHPTVCAFGTGAEENWGVGVGGSTGGHMCVHVCQCVCSWVPIKLCMCFVLYVHLELLCVWAGVIVGYGMHVGYVVHVVYVMHVEYGVHMYIWVLVDNSMNRVYLCGLITNKVHSIQLALIMMDGVKVQEEC